jgi:hypothetical protein
MTSMIVYIDNSFKCHILNDGTMREYDVPFFDGKCSTFIEGHRYVPTGEKRIGDDGTEYQGEQITPWADIILLQAAQTGYEESLISANKAYEEGVNSI